VAALRMGVSLDA